MKLFENDTHRMYFHGDRMVFEVKRDIVLPVIYEIERCVGEFRIQGILNSDLEASLPFGAMCALHTYMEFIPVCNEIFPQPLNEKENFRMIDILAQKLSHYRVHHNKHPNVEYCRPDTLLINIAEELNILEEIEARINFKEYNAV